MRKLKATVLILGVMILGIAASFGGYLALTASDGRSQPPEEPPRNGIWVVDTVDEASKIAGYPVRRPQFVPAGFNWGKIEIAQPTGNLLPKRVTHNATFGADESVGFNIVQDPTLKGIGGAEAVDILGSKGQRQLLPALPPGRPHDMVGLYLPDGKNGGYTIVGTLAGPLTEETLKKILISIPRN